MLAITGSPKETTDILTQGAAKSRVWALPYPKTHVGNNRWGDSRPCSPFKTTDILTHGGLHNAGFGLYLTLKSMLAKKQVG